MKDTPLFHPKKINELGENAINLKALASVKRFFVFKTDEVPMVELKAVDDLPEIKQDCGICSNLEEFQGCNEPVYKLKLSTKFVFSLPTGFTGCVRFTVDDTYEAQDVTINPKETFDELFMDENTNS